MTIVLPTAITGISRNIKNKLQNVERNEELGSGHHDISFLISVFETWAHVASSI